MLYFIYLKEFLLFDIEIHSTLLVVAFCPFWIGLFINLTLNVSYFTINVLFIICTKEEILVEPEDNIRHVSVEKRRLIYS